MLSLTDDRWRLMCGGYRIPVDVRPLLRRLEAGGDKDAWDSIWQELHHQGDVGEASYAATPHLVRMYKSRLTTDWNTYALVATIELARGEHRNPPVPEWLREGYEQAIDEIARIALDELAQPTADLSLARSALAVVAAWKGMRLHARLLSEFDDHELAELLKDRL